MAGDSPKCRDLVLGHGALMPLLAQFNEHAKLSMLRNATWTLSNFCRGKPQPLFDQVCFFGQIVGYNKCFLFILIIVVNFMSRQNLPCQHLSVSYIQMMMKYSQMRAGRCHISQMEPMTKFKLLLMLVSVPDLLNFCCEYIYVYVELHRHR